MWIYSPLISSIAEHYANRAKKEYRSLLIRAVLAILIIFIIIFIGAALLGNWGLHLLFGEEILDYAHLLIPVLFTTVLIALCYFMDMLLTVSRWMKATSLALVGALAAEFALSVLFVQTWGMDGVNYILYIAFGIALTIQVIFGFVTTRRHFAAS